MNVLLVHNFYQQPGGEDQVFADESALLASRGHRVEKFVLHNEAIEGMSRLRAARKTIWNRESADALGKLTRRCEADVVHFHNTFPLVSPAGYSAVRAEGAAVVQTLHNYRLLCPSATFYRDGHVCEDCHRKSVPWPSVAHACYRDSRAASAAVAVMLTVHRARGTYHNDVDAYIALTNFSRTKFVEAGLPAERIHVKPNFVDVDPGVGAGTGHYAAFVGRLTEEKGIPVLLKAWELIGKQFPLKIVGDGPLRPLVESAAAKDIGIEYLGRRPMSDVYDIVGEASALVFPSVWYEGLPRTIVEAYARGTPVVASRLGSIAELIQQDRTGLLFEPGNANDLANQVQGLINDPSAGARLRRGARDEFEEKYSADRNYPAMMEIYNAALDHVRQSSSASQRHAPVNPAPVPAGSHGAG